MSGINGEKPEISLSGPSVMAIAAQRAGVDLRQDPLADACAEAAKMEQPKQVIIGPHACHAVGCRTVVPPEQLMCRVHWTSLPLYLRKAVLIAYTPGQCKDTARIKQSWILAARQAIEYVLSRELPGLVSRVYANLPKGYEAEKLRVERVGPSIIAVVQEGLPVLLASLATGEVREMPKPEKPAAANDAVDPATVQAMVDGRAKLDAQPVPAEGRMLAPNEEDPGDAQPEPGA